MERVKKQKRLWHKFAESCTGCYEAGDYDSNAHNYPLHPKWQIRIGAGCKECSGRGFRVRKYSPGVVYTTEIEGVADDLR